ncbi:iron-sulfur cluster assembly scaffold protein NifU [Kocuria dechangensis]|uniref:Iron-sulfur cluster assembly scaffold protein NifU n=1 Tax=Kocuria dechangensis TaxID=1176249 RepID=A0A917H9P5_9MICC|nr:SUF system NifU family Fe-S cluster assembly protein [Kocuria dechangensis]GGG71801.1 iron-sulfur cluster assembly scaffold protein NifU [Kocuria dechangensis]
MSGLDGLYQEVILDHARRRSGEGLADPLPGHACGESHQYNPTCGDEITVRVELVPGDSGPGAEPVVERITWEGQGCSISMAAASVLAETAPGMTRTDLLALIEEFRALLRSRGTVEPDEELLGDAAAFAGVSRFVARVKCAMLGWVAAEEALGRAG